jgi:hypothetical protein
LLAGQHASEPRVARRAEYVCAVNEEHEHADEKEQCSDRNGFGLVLDLSVEVAGVAECGVAGKTKPNAGHQSANGDGEKADRTKGSGGSKSLAALAGPGAQATDRRGYGR